MLAQVFRKVCLGGELSSSRRAFQLNGFAEEWRLKLDAPGIPCSASDEPQELPLRPSEREALTLLFAEHDRFPLGFFDLMRGDLLAQDLKLLHLRWVLGNDQYEKHWRAWTDHRRSFPPDQFERLVLRVRLSPHCGSCTKYATGASRRRMQPWSIGSSASSMTALSARQAVAWNYMYSLFTISWPAATSPAVGRLAMQLSN